MKNKYIHVCLSLFSLSMLSALTPAFSASYVDVNDKDISPLLTANKQYDIRHSETVVLSNGLIKNKYGQYYQGVPIWNSLLTNSEIKGLQKKWQGTILINIDEDLSQVTPKITTKSAISLAKSHFKILEKDLVKNEKAFLYIRNNAHNKAELIYLVSFNIEGSRVHRPYYMINALTGDIIQAWDGLTRKQAEGPGGNEKTMRYYYGRDFGFLNVAEDCSMTNTNVETYDMNNQDTGGVLYQFTCPVNNNKAVNGAYSPLNDGHYFASMVFKMYKNWYSTAPINKKLKVYVHYGQNQADAHWDGEKMKFGDGDALSFYPLTALDVLAHEVSHAVTERYSGLVYFGQAGGINESFSDIAGETAEAFMNKHVNKENDWLVGATIMKGENKAMRYFSDPTLDHKSIGHTRDYYATIDPHYSSGIFNKAFYNLATKDNWGIRQAFSVFLAANQVYWRAESTFDNAACGIVRAANDLGFSAAKVSDIVQSFQTVGVNATCPSQG